MKNSVQVHAKAVNKRTYVAPSSIQGTDATDYGLWGLLCDKNTGRLMVQAGDDRESVNLKAWPVGLTLLFDAGTYAAGDCLGGLQQCEGLVGKVGEALIESVRVTDLDNQGAAFDILFMDANPTASTFTANSPPVWVWPDANKIVGYMRILTTDYVDMGGILIAQKVFPVPVRSNAADGTVFAVAISRGTPTYSGTITANVRVDLFVKQS